MVSVTLLAMVSKMASVGDSDGVEELVGDKLDDGIETQLTMAQKRC